MCAATKGGLSLAGVDVTKEAVIQGCVLRGGNPVAGAYVRLLDSAVSSRLRFRHRRRATSASSPLTAAGRCALWRQARRQSIARSWPHAAPSRRSTSTSKLSNFVSCSRNRAWNPPTSSSLAEEERLRSLLLSTAVRDFPTLTAQVEPSLNVPELLGSGIR